MATINILPNGSTSGNPSIGGNKNPSKRSDSGGWNDQVSRRMTKWFYSIPVDSLTGHGIAFTLTVRDCPETAKDWAYIRGKFLDRLRGDGCIRAQWLTEWQERGVPHLHGVAYFEQPYPIEKIVNHWLTLASKKYGSGTKGQNAKPITNVTGWLQYLAKHSTRSAEHYQRAAENIPYGWLKTGRMWGYIGNWDIREPMKFLVCQNGFYAFRRICKQLKSSSVRSRYLNAREAIKDHATNNPIVLQKIFEYGFTESDERAFLRLFELQKTHISAKAAFVYNRAHQKNPDKETSHFKGTSNWVGMDLTIKIITFLSDAGYRVNQSD